MPIYKLNGEVYNIPEDVVADFEKDNPSATVTYRAGDDEYEIPVSERDAFLKDFPDAQASDNNLAGKPQDAGSSGKQGGGYTPNAEEMAGFQRTIGQARQTVIGSQQGAKRIDARQKRAGLDMPGTSGQYGRVELGKNRKVVETDPHFNLETGKMESTYITEQGNEYQTREGADIEQNAVDIAKRQMSLPGQLEDAYAERDRLDGEIAALEAKYNGALQENNGFVYHDKNQFTDEDDAHLQTLKAARRQNEQRIIALEAERDDDGGTQFWRGFLDAAKNPSTWSFGLTDLDDMRQLMRVKDKVDAGEELTDDEEALLKNTMANGYAQQMFGENRGFMYRAGGISMQALPFVAEFMATGGFSALTEMGANAGTRVAEKFALDGMKKSFLRNTGVVMGDIASSFIMANTTGAARTGADIMERNIGQVAMDEDGNYQFEGGKSLGRSIYEGEVASTLEYYTEKLGEHLQLGNWIAKGADKMGLSKLSKAVGYLSNSKMLNAGGIQDYPSEVVEEQANLLLNAILVGDNNFNGPDDPHSVINLKTQLDIWGGMLFSIGLMQAPRLAYTGYNAAGYYAYKYGLDVADTKASSVFGADNWQMIKEQIDNCENTGIGELLASVVTGDMSSEQKEATMFYADNLLKMRGYNNGMMADVRGEASGENTAEMQGAEEFLSHGIDQGYQQGHEAQEPDEKKIIVDEANEAEARLADMFTEEDVQFITNTAPMDAINIMLSNRGTNAGEWNDDDIAAVVDYYQKQARAQGVMDAAADDVEYQVAKANAEVDANTHKALNQMIMAESGGELFYIVGGDVSLMPAADATGVVAFDMEGTGDALIVRNAETGEISVKSPQMLSVTQVNDPNQLKTINETQLRQEVTQQHDDEITFGSPAQEVFQLNDTVMLNDGQGNVIEGEIGQMPNAVDGVYVVYTSDGKAMQFTGDELNKMIVAHNGMEVQRSTMQPSVVQPEEAGLDNADGEAGAESGTGANEPSATASEPQQEPEPEQPQSALDRIPVLQDASGKPILNRKGKKQYQWHKASVDDTADALTETTGGDMVMARDTATDLINNAKGKLEKIRKQKPKGDDPIEIAESRAEIRKQEQEQQEIINHWQRVNQTIQRRMQEESARRQAEEQASKSEEQRRQEAEEQRLKEERLNEIERQRLREAIAKEQERRNKEYEPLVQARKDMADDPDALDILNDTEPRDLREWVSSLLRPHSILWQDASDSEVGLRSELGLKRGDMQRFMTLLGTKESGAVPFGKAVLDIHEGLPEGMKEQYTDQDVRNVVLDLFQSAANSREMMNLTAENRIAEAKAVRDNRIAQEAEWEMEAWCEHYHLTPEERATFEDLMSTEPPYAVEEDIINQIIADNEQVRTSAKLDSPDVSGRNEGELEEGKSQVQGTVEATSDGIYAERVAQGSEAVGSEPPVSGDNVAGGASADRESVAALLDQIGADGKLAERMSDYEVEQMNALIEDWDAVNSEYGEVIEQQKPALQSKNKATRDAAQKIVDEAQAKANEAFEPIEMYIEELNTKYGIESEEPFEGAIPRPKIDKPRMQAIRKALTDAYRTGDKKALQSAAKQMQDYVDEGLDDYAEGELVDDFETDDTAMLAEQYIQAVFMDRYVDDDADQEYIKTGLKPSMKKQVYAYESSENTINPMRIKQEVFDEAAAAQQANAELIQEYAERMNAEEDESAQDAIGDELERKLNLPFHLVINWGWDGKKYNPHIQARTSVENGNAFLFLNEMPTIFKEGDNISFTHDGSAYFGTVTKVDSDGKILEAVDTDSRRIIVRDGKPLNRNDITNQSPVKLSEQLKPTDTDSISALDQFSESKPIGKTSTPEEIAAEEGKVDTNPTDAQKEAGNYQKGHINVDGYDITIENPKGSVRSGVDSEGNRWETTMRNTYGYIRGTEGVDGDHIDLFLSDTPTSGKVFVIDQVNPGTGEFDEHKVMYGFASEEEAREAYLANYEEGWQGLGTITEVSREEFKKWVESSHRKTKPFADYKSVKKGAAVTQQPTQQEQPDAEAADAAAKPQPTTEPQQPAADATGTVANPSGNKLVTDERYEQLRERMKKKLLGQFNMGIDPEILAIGTEMAVYHIEKGARAFAEYAKAMIADLGDAIRPYLKAFYNGARDLPEMGELSQGMDDYAAVQGFDVFNFDKQKQPSLVEKAQQVVSQAKADKEAAEAVQKIQEIAKKGSTRKGAKKPQQVQTPSLFDMFEPKGKTAWWQDENRPKNLDPGDYTTYTTDEAKAYFAQFRSADGKVDFTKWAHPNLAYITAAAWDGAVIPVEELMQIPEIQEAEERIKSKKGSLNINEEEQRQHVAHLLDGEHGSAVFENGKIKKVNGEPQFTGPVRQERKAFIVIGLPAGGKSSVFANLLSYDNGAHIIDSDVVKPWLNGYDEGYGAGYVQLASARVADAAIMEAAKRSENMVIPRIGGDSVIKDVVIPLREMGYDVQLYWNDVSKESSIMRATSRFAEEGRYLSLGFLTNSDRKDSKTFSTFAEKKLGDYYAERDDKETADSRHSVSSSGRVSDVLDSRGSREGNLEQARSGAGSGVREVVQGARERVESERGGTEVPEGELIFSYAEWKSNDVAFGEKPKEIWNSKSGKPMPGTVKKNSNEGEQKISGKPESVGQGAEQASGATERTGTERSPEQNRAERSGSGRTVETGVATESQPTEKSTPHKNIRNNVGERGKDYAPLSPKARFNANVQAIKIMRLLVDEGIEVPTKDQMEALRQYSGWGGMGTFFNDENSAENKILRDLLSEEEYNDAALSIKTAYYTPATVIDTLWDLAKAAGFKGGNVLEGSAGIGNIIGQMPKEMSRRSDIEAVELDSISGNILKLLYPDAKVHIQGFQDTVIPNGTVDLAITNVPFAADISVIDKVDKDLSRQFRQLHDFCIAKNIRKLKEGGIGIFITTSGTLDKSTKLREWIPDGGQSDVIGAFRLHNKTFGGTNVTSDIIVVRKRVNGQKSPNAIDISKATPLRIGTYEDKFHNEHQASMVVNDYFKEHPDMMAGEMAFGYEKGDTYRPGSYGLYPVDGKDQEKMLQAFVKGIKEDVAAEPRHTEQEPVKNQLTAEKEGRMLIDGNGRLCVSERGVAVPLALNTTKVKGQTKEQCFKDYQDVQKAVDDVLQQQLSDPDDTALQPKLDALNKAFDKFVKRYGHLHKNTAIAFLRNDIDFPSFLALENYSESKDMNGKVTVTTRKTPLFSQRVLGFKTEPQPKNIKDAVTASIFRSNSIDIPWIAERLGKSEEDVRNEILESRLGFEDPSTGQLEIRYKYLSGNVREKLAIAEAYNKPADDSAGVVAGRYAANVEELRKVVPMDIPAHLIDFSLGSSWIPKEIYTDYLKEVYDLENAKLTHIEGSWVLDEGSGYRNEKNRAAGVYSEQFRENIYGHQLVLAALNNRPVKVQKQESEGYGPSRTTRTVTDQTATQACAVRVDEIKDDFKQFAKKKMQDNLELAAQVERIYNEKFNALVPMQIDDEFLPDVFEGANMNIHLYGHQKRGVMRGLTSPTMLAHEVGTGKSFTLISTAMEMKRLGTAKKPMIVVQNATVAQMTADAKLLYPNARVLSLSEKDRSAEGRRSFYAKIKYNDWDLIIVPQSTFERIPDSPERELQFIQEKIDEKKHVIEAAEQSGMDSREIERLKRELDKIEQEYGDTFLDSGGENAAKMHGRNKSKKKDAKQEATAMEKAKVKAQEQLDRAVDDVQYFDDLGVDALLVDEAHEYKHLGFQTSIGRGIKGIDPSYSKKCAGLYNKTRCVFEKAGWKNVVFATGTPISNTAAEIWTFMKYLMPADVMRANDIYYFDDFVHNFGNISQMLEFATSGKFKENTRFAAYVNKPELIRIWSQVADTVLTREVGAVNEKIPALEGGKDQDIFLPQSPSLIRIMNAVRKELERFENMTGKEKKENSSIPLTMYGIAKRAAIDPRLVDAEAPDEPKSKTNAAVKEIVKDLEATKDYKGTVAVFCDNQNRLGRSGGKGVVEFNIYDDMKAKLIKAGVPENQIAIIKSGMSITAKQKVFDAVNSGDIRVVLGSTQTLGTGVNMQERLHLLIHMDAPDRPMDYTQRNGRIKRQGNLHKTWGKTIRVLRFGVEDSLDVTAYQRLKTKSGFIDSIMDGKGALLNNQVDRTVEEEEEGLFDNPVAVLSGSQYALKKNQAERELRKYQSKRAQWEADQVYVNNALRQNKNEVETTNRLIADEEKQLAHIRKLFPDGKVKTVTVEGVPVNLGSGDATSYGTLLKVIKEKINEPVNATVKRLRENEIYNDEVMNFTIELDGHKVEFKVSVEREAMYDNGKIRTVVHKYTTYDSPSIGIYASMKSSKSVNDHLNDILDEVVSGRDNTDRIETYKAKIERIDRETEQLQQRVGMEFQYGKELEEARKHVEEYTELMKQEMKEKEAKYAAQESADDSAGVVAFDLKKVEESEEEEEEDVRYSAAEDDLDEEALIIAQAKATDTYMRAPNGKPSNLNERQWVQVRTQAFKDWFGDWENDPENASQVVDENGEPKVMYHGTNLTDVNHSTPFWAFYPDSHFGTLGQARSRLKIETWMPALTESLKNRPQIRRAVKTYAVFLNIRNAQRRSDADQDYLDEKDMTMSEYWEQSARRSKYNGYDGIVYLNEYEDKAHPADSWIAFRPEQVKSADENVGTFDSTNPDIRYREAERFAEGQTFPIHTTHNYSDNVMDTSRSYSTDLMPDEYGSTQQLLDGLRRQFPDYWVSLDGDMVRFESWQHALHGADVAAKPQQTRQAKAHKSYIERKTHNAINAINELAGRMGLDVEILTTTEGLQGKKARSKGWFNTKTGKITIVLPNNTNLTDVINTLLHEGVAHYGLRKMFGKNFGTFLDNVYNNVSPEIKAIIDASMKRNKWSQHEATEEYLARLAERTDFEHATQQGWWNKIKEFFFEMWRNIGLPDLGGKTAKRTLSDNELRYILWRSYENLVHPGRNHNIFEEARDVAMQAKLRVGKFARERERLLMTGRTDSRQLAAAEPGADALGAVAEEAEDLFSVRKKDAPKKTGIGYKVFFLHNGQLYPPMVANPDGEGTPVGIWLDADAAPVAATSKTGRKKVKAGGKGTQGGSGQLAYRPGWHLGTIPYALQFNRGEKVDNPLGITNNDGEVIKVGKYFPNDFVWAEVEYADDNNYQEEAESYGYKENGKFQHSLAGLPRIPEDGSYTYRTNPNPATDPWIITGAMRVNRILSREEVADIVRQAGREPQLIQEGDIVTQEAVDALNEEIRAMRDADDMGLLFRDDDDDIAKDIYEDFVAKDSFKFKENWQDSMASLKAIQKAIAAETGKVATGAEDAYRFENRMHGRAKNMTEKYDYNFYRPMLKAFHEFCKQCNMSIEHGMDYLISKSGLERNVYYAFRDATKAKITHEINEERNELEKQYAKGNMSEDDYKAKKKELEEREKNGVDDFMQQVRAMFPYQHAKQEYEKGIISYTEYLRIIEKVIREELKKPKKKETSANAPGTVAENYYDEQVKDYSGLTETFAKDMYDEAQSVKKRAQRAIDPDERKALWHEYNEKMRQAYITAREVAEDQVFVAEGQSTGDSEDTLAHKKLWDAINAATKETLKHSYESGMMDRNTYNKVRDMFDWYIPLRGWEEDKASDVYTYMGRDNVFSPAVKKVWGRQSKAENPLAYIGNIAVSTILSGHRNQLKQHFLNYVMNNPTSLVSISESWYEDIAPDDKAPVWVLRTADTAGKAPDEIAQIVNDFNDEMAQKQREGKAMPVRGRLRLDVHATKGQKSEHVVEVQRAGHTYQLYINGDPKAAQALNGSAARAVSRISDTWLGKKIAKINRDMATFFTSKNPAFVVSNLSRDLNMAGASVAINEGKAYNARFIANVATVLRPRLGESSKWVPASKQPTGMMPSLMRKWQNGSLNQGDETERLFGEFMDEGGETGFVNMLSIDSFKERMQKEIREMNGSSLFGAKAKVKECSTRKALRLLGETFEFYNRCAEDATRFIVYMTSRQMGKTLEESIADAKDVTLNFNRKGTGGMGNAEVRDLFIFVNPAIQALANMYRMAAHKPLKFGAVTAAFVAGGALMPIINQWLLQLFGDDDDKQAYWNLPPWVRKNNLVWWIPGTKNFVTIPLAQEFRVFYGVGEMLSSTIMDHPVDKWGLEVFSSVADLVPINPTGNGGNLMVDFAPTMVQPLMQVGENVDFTGKPIWRENQGNKHAPMYSKAYVSTPQWMVKLSEGLNDITGGNEGRKGVVERYAPVWGDYINNPAVWNHLLQGYFGGMYNTIAKSADVVATAASGELPKIYQTPVVNRFLNRPVERDHGSALGDEYYSLINERDETMYEVRTWKKKVSELPAGEPAGIVARKHLEELIESKRYQRAEVITHYENILKVMKAGERAIKEGAKHSDNDLHDIHAGMDLYKTEMLEELAAIGEGKEPLDAAIEKFDNARSLAEKNKLKLRIERLVKESSGNATTDRTSDVEKAMAYLRGENVESHNAGEHYLMLSTGEDMAADARIKAAKARIKKVTDEYKRLVAEGRSDDAATYRTEHAKWFEAENIINSQQRGIATNKKLLGKDYDSNIMQLIRAQRDKMLKAIEGLE